MPLISRARSHLILGSWVAMQVYKMSDPGSLDPRSHPWTSAVSDSAFRYIDFQAQSELIRSSIEDLQDWGAYPSTETFYQLLEWLNGPESVFESNDCAFNGPTRQVTQKIDKRFECSGRLMILYRELALNTVVEAVHSLTQAFAGRLSQRDPDFAWGAVGVTCVEVRFRTLPGPVEAQRGQQLMLSFWAWGDDENETMASLDRTLSNLAGVLRDLSAEIAAA